MHACQAGTQWSAQREVAFLAGAAEFKLGRKRLGRIACHLDADTTLPHALRSRLVDGGFQCRRRASRLEKGAQNCKK